MVQVIPNAVRARPAISYVSIDMTVELLITHAIPNTVKVRAAI